MSVRHRVCRERGLAAGGAWPAREVETLCFRMPKKETRGREVCGKMPSISRRQGHANRDHGAVLLRARQGGWREKGRGRQQALARPWSIGGGTQESALQAKAPASAKAREGEESLAHAQHTHTHAHAGSTGRTARKSRGRGLVTQAPGGRGSGWALVLRVARGPRRVLSWALAESERSEEGRGRRTR